MTAKKTAARKSPSKGSSATRARKKEKTTAPKTSEQYFALSNSAQDSWNRVAHVITKMRSEGTSLTKASREFGLDPRKVRSRAGSALQKAKNGRYVTRSSDRLLRVMVIPTSKGSQEVAVRGSSVASRLAQYMVALQKYMRTGNSSSLKKFQRLKLPNEKGERIVLVTDLAELRRLGSAGALSFESLYRSAA